MRIYVAAPFPCWRRVREVHALLMEAGHEITCDWTAGADQGLSDASLDDAARRRAATNDLRGVRTADAVVVLLDREHKGQGVWIEMGSALALNVPVVTLGDAELRRSIFFEMTHHATDERDLCSTLFLMETQD